MTRTGKIARLPYGLRHELNYKIQNGLPGVEILGWLNTTKEARAVVGRFFGGRPISEQNLTEWKAGGYPEWERHMETREWVEDMVERSDDLSDAAERRAPWDSIADRMSTLVAVELARSLKEISADPKLSSLERLDAILKINQATAQLRRGDHGKKRMVWQAEWKEREREEAEEEKRLEEEARARSIQMLQALEQEQEVKHAQRMEALRRQAETARPSPANAPSMSGPETELAPAPANVSGSQGGGEVWEEENGGVQPATNPVFQGESGQIKVNQTSGDGVAPAPEPASVENPELPVEGVSGPENVWKGYPWPAR